MGSRGSLRSLVRPAAALTFTVVLASSHPMEALTAAVQRLLPQCRRAGAQLIVVRPDHGERAGDAILDGCTIIACRPAAGLPEIRGRGLAAADGDWVLLTEDNCLARSDWVARLTAACTAGLDVVGGVIMNGNNLRPVDAAAGFAEYGFYGPMQRTERPIPGIACANVAYRRHVAATVAARSLAGAWEHEIHEELAEKGAAFSLAQGAIVEQTLRHHVRAFCRNRYEHGQHYAATRSELLSILSRITRAAGSPALPLVLAWRIWRTAGRAAPRDFVRALPFTLLFLASWSAGEAVGYAFTTADR